MSKRVSGDGNPRFGVSMSEDTKNKIAEKATGRLHSEEAKLKMSKSRKGKLKSEEHKRKMSEAQKRIDRSHQNKKVLCIELGLEFASVKDAKE